MMNLGPSAASKPRLPQPIPARSMGSTGCPNWGCCSGSNDIVLAIPTSGFKLSHTSSRNPAAKRAIREAGALINAGSSWQMPGCDHESPLENENSLK